MANLLKRASSAVRAAVSGFRYPLESSSAGGVVRGYGSHDLNFLENVGEIRTELKDAIALTDPAGNSAVVACLGWILDVWPEAPLRVYRTPDDGDQDRPVKEPYPSKDVGIRALQELLRRPSESHTPDALWKGTAGSIKLAANGYWKKIRSRDGAVVGFEFMPSHLVGPRWPRDGSAFISHYEYRHGHGKPEEIDPADVVHFRDGIDPKNTRLGFNRLVAALTEVFTDDNTALFAAAIMSRMGVISYAVSPDPALWHEGKGPVTEDEELDRIKDKLRRETRGDNRHGLAVSGLPMSFHRLGFPPSEANFREVRMTPEERICAIFRIPPGVVKLGAGLERNTYSNAATEEEQAYRAAVMPMQRLVIDALEHSVLPEFTQDPSYSLGFDLTNVNALQEDEDAKAKRFSLLFTSDLATRFECKSELGMQAEEADRVYRSEWLRTLGPALPAPGAPPQQDEGEERAPFKGRELKKRGKTLDEAARDYRLALVARDQAIVAELGAYLEAAEAGILARWKDVTELIEEARAAGEAVSESWLFLQARYRALESQVRDEMERFGLLAEPRVAAQQTEFALLGAQAAEEMAAIAAEQAGIAATFTRLPVAQLESFAGFASDGSPLRALFDALGEDLSAAVRGRLAEGIATGEGSDSLAGGLEPLLGGNRNRAMTIARTEPHRAGREAVRQSYLQNAALVTGWVWVSAADRRTCAGCWSKHGTRHTAGQTLEGHPQCRCVMVPDLKGAPAQVPSGEELFGRLSEEEQREALGPLYELYTEGQVGWGDLAARHVDERWGGSWHPATRDEALASAQASQLPRAS